jgi:hypothetical protein
MQVRIVVLRQSASGPATRISLKRRRAQRGSARRKSGHPVSCAFEAGTGKCDRRKPGISRRIRFERKISGFIGGSSHGLEDSRAQPKDSAVSGVPDGLGSALSRKHPVHLGDGFLKARVPA